MLPLVMFAGEIADSKVVLHKEEEEEEEEGPVEERRKESRVSTGVILGS